MYKLRPFKGPRFDTRTCIPNSAYIGIPFHAYGQLTLYYDVNIHSMNLNKSPFPYVKAHEEGHAVFQHLFKPPILAIRELQADIYTVAKLGPEVVDENWQTHVRTVYELYEARIRAQAESMFNNRPNAKQLIGPTESLSAWMRLFEAFYRQRKTKITDTLDGFTQERAKHYVEIHLAEMR